jgi:hypothetical protein
MSVSGLVKTALRAHIAAAPGVDPGVNAPVFPRPPDAIRTLPVMPIRAAQGPNRSVVRKPDRGWWHD